MQLTDEQIREIFMAHGFTIKEGQTDLKPYVYAAARALLSASKPAAPNADWLSKAVDLYDACKLWPESSGEGFMALLRLRNHVGELLAASPAAPGQKDAQLLAFLDAAAGEGLILDGIDAAELYIRLFPDEYAANLEKK